MIKLTNLNFTYPQTQNGIKNINLTLNAKNMIAVIGKNGSGKTTLMNLLTENLIPDSGMIEKTITIKEISYCRQKQSIDWYLNVEQNVNIASILYGGKTFSQINSLIGLENKKRHAVDTLSGGQQQRVQVGRALAQNAKIYILDEPTVGLDFEYAIKMMEYLKTLVEIGNLVLISSHDMTLLEKYCNQIIYIKDGELEFYGDMDTFKQQFAKEVKFVQIQLDKEVSDTFSFEIEEVFKNNIKIKIANFNDVSNILHELQTKGYTIQELNTKNQTLLDILLEATHNA